MVSQPTARELQGTVLRVMNRASVSRRESAVSARQVARTRRANPPTAGAVPNSPAWPATPPSAHAFSSCTSPVRSRPRHRSISVGAVRARHSARVPKRISSVLEDEPEQHEAKVAVDRPRPGCVLERQRADGILNLVAALVRAVQRHPPRQAAAVLEQVAYAHVDSIPTLPSRQPGRHRIRQPHSSPFYELHRQRRGRDHLGQGCEVEDRLFGRGPRVRIAGETAGCMAPDHALPRSNLDDCCGVRASGHACLEQPADAQPVTHAAGHRRCRACRKVRSPACPLRASRASR